MLAKPILVHYKIINGQQRRGSDGSYEMAKMNVAAVKEAILNGSYVRSGNASASAQAWLRTQVKTGRIVRMTGVEGWCPAHSRWTFYVGHNSVQAFLAKCAFSAAERLTAILMDSHPSSIRSRNARHWNGQTLAEQEARYDRLMDFAIGAA